MPKIFPSNTEKIHTHSWNAITLMINSTIKMHKPVEMKQKGESRNKGIMAILAWENDGIMDEKQKPILFDTVKSTRIMLLVVRIRLARRETEACVWMRFCLIVLQKSLKKSIIS